MTKKSALTITATNFLAASALAGAMGSATEHPNWTLVAGLSAGPVWTHGGSTQTFYITPEIEKSYVANQSTSNLFKGEIFLGAQKNLFHSFQGQLGLAVAAASDANLSGIIWDDADSQFDNFIYRYSIQHTHMAVKGRLLYDKNYWLIPWIDASLGIGFNNAHSYHNVPTIFEALASPDFAAHKQTSFTYTLGTGIQKALNEHWQIGLGYEFADWGKSRLERSAEQTQNSGLTLNHLYTNGALFNLTYIA